MRDSVMKHRHNAYLVLPRMRIQNLNCISSPLTWGAPSITASIGFMYALQRKIPNDWQLDLLSVGMVVHEFEPQVYGEYEKRFCLTRNPLGSKGQTLAIVEEGRAHATISLIFGIDLFADDTGSDELLQERAREIQNVAESIGFAGGRFLPAGKRWQQAQILLLHDDDELDLALGDSDASQAYRQLKRSLLPGSALISRDDVLLEHIKKMQAENPEATALDALLDLSRLNYRYVADEEGEGGSWQIDKKPGQGWLVPIPVGYTALTKLYEPGEVLNARDPSIPFRFVESLYSIGEWRSPHRMESLRDLLWQSYTDHDAGLYRCINQAASLNSIFN